ncbi:MAG: hypothetical protein HYV09_30125 [Deltaproteobacteria bacterium]|nr:hypothetical protein [Deltaproteobacteria bacterium]
MSRRDVPERLECWLQDGDRPRWVRAVYVKAWVTIIACATLWSWDLRWPALAAAALGVVWASRDFRQRRGVCLVLQVHGDRVRVERKAGGPVEVDLDELHDVRLDTKSTSKNLTVARADGVNSVFGAASAHDIVVDVSRIELVLEGDDVVLDPEYINHSLCSEALRTIRLFLRAHGWKPFDERTATVSS